MVNQHGIEVNPKKIKILLNMRSPSKPKEVQSLKGRLVALIQFISKVIEKCLSFFKFLREEKGSNRTRDVMRLPSAKEAFWTSSLLSKPK